MANLSPITDEERATFTPLYQVAMEKFGALPEDIRGKMMEDHHKREAGDADTIAQDTAEKEEAFAAADADGNGLIELEEWDTLCNLRNAKSDERYGGHMENTDEERKAWFDALNTLTPDTDGFSRDDSERSEKVIAKTIIGEMMAAQAQPSE